MKQQFGTVIALVLAITLVILLLLPVGALVDNISFSGLALAWNNGGMDAVIVSMSCTALAVVAIVVFGTPVGWFLARRKSYFWRVIEFLLFIPLLMPPLVVGLLLMYFLGPYGWFGRIFSALQWTITNSASAVVIAQIYEAIPYYIFSAAAAFSQVDAGFERTSWSLGRTPWYTLRKVTIPLALPGLSAGCAMAFARAVGAFGAVVVIAYYPHTLPVQIWVALQEQGLPAAFPLALILLLMALPFPLLIVLWRYKRDARM